MTNLVEHLKNAENADKVGFRRGMWQPHASFEKGTRTVAYGHKLSKEEDKGNFVRLPDGRVRDIEQGGLTEEQAVELLLHDIAKLRNSAEV